MAETRDLASRSGARLKRDVVAPASFEERQEAWSWVPDDKSTG
jgi:hypothetical protein